MSVKRGFTVLVLVAFGLLLIVYLLSQPNTIDAPTSPVGQKQPQSKSESQRSSSGKSGIKKLSGSEAWTGVTVVAKNRPTWHKGHISHLSVKGRNRSRPEFETLPPLPPLDTLPHVTYRYDVPKLYAKLQKEKGLRRLIKMWEVLNVEDESKCLTHAEAINSGKSTDSKPHCIQPKMLTDDYIDHFESFSTFIHPNPAKDRPVPEKVTMRLGPQMWPGYPYIDGRAFKEIADCAHETNNYLFSMGTSLRRTKCYGNQIFNRSLVYWYLDAVDLAKLRTRLFEEHFISEDIKFFLLVHNLDTPKFPAWVLDHPQILKIFSVNVNSSVYHPKVVPLPLGIHWRKSNETTEARLQASKSESPSNLLFVKFKIPKQQNGTARGVVRMLRRAEVVKALHDNGFPGMTAEEILARVPLEEFQRLIINSQFVPSPGGNGLDTYRTWQVLYLGRVPIVDTAMRPDLFHDLPVMVVDNWSKVTQQSLKEWWAHASQRRFNTGKLWFKWWVAFILKECLNTP